MTAAVLGDRGLPWTEEDYLALGETKDRVELFDGSLLVSPAPTPRHQRISSRLYIAFEAAAEAAGLHVYEAINVRLRTGRIPIPDLAITVPIDPDQAVVDVDNVLLISEIVSNNNPGADRLPKMQYYADAGIPWYLLVEQEPKGFVSLHLLRLDGTKYASHSVGAGDVPLTMTEPVAVTIDPSHPS